MRVNRSELSFHDWIEQGLQSAPLWLSHVFVWLVNAMFYVGTTLVSVWMWLGLSYVGHSLTDHHPLSLAEYQGRWHSAWSGMPVAAQIAAAALLFALGLIPNIIGQFTWACFRRVVNGKPTRSFVEDIEDRFFEPATAFFGSPPGWLIGLVCAVVAVLQTRREKTARLTVK